MDLHLEIAGPGDGWLIADTDEWLTEKVGNPDHDLTDDLADWIDANAGRPPGCDAPAQWATRRFAHTSGPGRDDDNPARFDSTNSENILSENICVTVMRVRDHDGEDMTLAVVEHRDVYVLGPAQEWTDAVDWSRAHGRCPDGHTYTLEAASYLHSDHDQATYPLTELCHTLSSDADEAGGYVACPACEQSIAFTT